MFSGLITKLGLGLLWSRAKTNAASDWASLSPAVKKWLLIGVACLAALLLHQWYAHRQLKAADTAGYQRRIAEDAKVIAQLKARATTAETNWAKLAQEERTRHDQEVHSNAAAADALRVHGPGAASCRSVVNPGTASRASQPVWTGSKADAPMGSVPDAGGSELIALPFDGTVAFAQQNDDLRSEVKAWHDWYPRMVAEWEKLRQPLASARK